MGLGWHKLVNANCLFMQLVMERSFNKEYLSRGTSSWHCNFSYSNLINVFPFLELQRAVL